MAKVLKGKKRVKVRSGSSAKGKGKAKRALLPLPEYGVDILNNPDLMESEMRFTRDSGLEIKALLDRGEDGNFSVVHRKYLFGKLIYDETLKVPYDAVMGSGLAGDAFDAVIMGEV